MYISKMRLQNFRSFRGVHEFNFSEGINFFVGNNNCGKTTVFKAVEFIQSGKSKEGFITKGEESNNISVEIEFSGSDLADIVNDESLNLKKYSDYLIDNHDGSFSLRIMRSSEPTKIIQKNKEVSLDLSKVRVYNPQSQEDDELKKFENPTGIDKTITALFDAQFVYSDLKNEDYQDFGKTKILGKIINDITKDFQGGDTWKEFTKAHSKAFGDEGMGQILKNTAESISTILKEQYGDGEVTFNFGLPEIDNFFKTGNLILSDNGVSTSVSEKGTGMQRALALSLIQVYAGITHKSTAKISKPILFFIDEPETFLHPKAQDKLIDALNLISAQSQVFITTHSPYLLKKFKKDTQQLTVFSRNEELNTSMPSSKQSLDLFGSFSPTWGEINYFAFQVPSVEFHNELYGFIQSKAIDENDKNYFEKDFDKWLTRKGIPQDKLYQRMNKNGSVSSENKTLPTLIRNVIHHPENPNNSYTFVELEDSIKLLVDVLKSL